MRRDDWPERLVEYVGQHEAASFSWGRHDCCTFAAGAVEAMTGIRWMEEFTGRYETEDQAVSALRNIGAGDLYRTIRNKFGKPMKPAAAQRGDLMLARMDGAPSLLICVGREAVGPGVGGLVRLPVSDCKFAWRI